MNSTTDTPLSVRSGRTTRPDPTSVWPPLAELTEAAANASTGSDTVAITRGFDRKGRQRAKALSELLDDRGVAAVEVTPAPDSEQLLAGSEVAAVANLVGAGSWQPYRLAAKTGSPVLTPRPNGDAPADEVARDVIGMAGTEGARDVALTRVAVLPESSENADESSITITRDGEPLSIPGGQVTVTLHEQRLHVQLQGPDFAAQEFAAQEITIDTSGTPHRLIRDELPIAEFEGTLTFTSEPRGLVVRPV
ncbi:hypothetical protein DFQ14_103142 [Halopolyspora algeriensis]|uniref:Uncharacterized protein n=1 Tax=Halopolyspora algeriensis TaxID=1500506 RepID=A0A368VY66_9ACTN|nr:hypothetical protein [Halopolyspora algeriensis]RCW45177.1 hypothetical protein DFQ14_103142 [Halopolyspora algeriensis]TQM53104.1 hypothetical protein FHU43_2482 [Halopolyspora algeriensis]